MVGAMYPVSETEGTQAAVCGYDYTEENFNAVKKIFNDSIDEHVLGLPIEFVEV